MELNLELLIQDWLEQCKHVIALDKKYQFDVETKKILLQHLLQLHTYNASFRVDELHRLGYQGSPFSLTGENNYVRSQSHELNKLLFKQAKANHPLKAQNLLKEIDVAPLGSREFVSSFEAVWSMPELIDEVRLQCHAADEPDILDKIIDVLAKKAIWLNDFIDDPNTPDPLLDFCKRVVSALPESFADRYESLTKSLLKALQAKKTIKFYFTRCVDSAEYVYCSEKLENSIFILGGFFLSKREVEQLFIAKMLEKNKLDLHKTVIAILEEWCREYDPSQHYRKKYKALIKHLVTEIKGFSDLDFLEQLPKIEIFTDLIAQLRELDELCPQDRLLTDTMIRISEYCQARLESCGPVAEFFLYILGRQLSLFLQSDTLQQKTRCCQTLQSILLAVLQLNPDPSLNLGQSTCDYLRSHGSLQYFCQPVVFGMQANTAAILALGRHTAVQQKTQLNVAVFVQNYFEVSTVIDRLYPNNPIKINQINLDQLDQLWLSNVDIVILDLHPNAARSKMIYPHNVKLWLQRELITLEAPVTVILDITINQLHDPEIANILSLVNQHENGHLVNIIFIQSLTKLGQMGSDCTSGGLLATSNIGDNWDSFNQAVVDISRHFRLTREAAQYFCFHLTRMQDLSENYFKIVQENTTALYNRCKSYCESIEIGDRYTAMRLQVLTDDKTCYLAFDFSDFFLSFTPIEDLSGAPDVAQLQQMHPTLSPEFQKSFLSDVMSGLILPLIEETNVPITFRNNFGFLLSSIAVCVDAIRMTVGIEYESILEDYETIIGDIAFILNRCEDPNILLYPDRRRAYFVEMLDAKRQYLATGTYDTHVSQAIYHEVGEGEYWQVSTAELSLRPDGAGLAQVVLMNIQADDIERAQSLTELPISVSEWGHCELHELSIPEQVHFLWTAMNCRLDLTYNFEGLEIKGFTATKYMFRDDCHIHQPDGVYTVKIHLNNFEVSHNGVTYSAESCVYRRPGRIDFKDISVSAMHTHNRYQFFKSAFSEDEHRDDSCPLKFEVEADKMIISPKK